MLSLLIVVEVWFRSLSLYDTYENLSITQGIFTCWAHKFGSCPCLHMWTHKTNTWSCSWWMLHSAPRQVIKLPWGCGLKLGADYTWIHLKKSLTSDKIFSGHFLRQRVTEWCSHSLVTFTVDENVFYSLPYYPANWITVSYSISLSNKPK
jgi:hypothetical protein